MIVTIMVTVLVGCAKINEPESEHGISDTGDSSAIGGIMAPMSKMTTAISNMKL